MARSTNNGLSTAAITVLEKIDSAMIEKAALATDMKKNALKKYQLLRGRKKRDEGVKTILKGLLVNEDDTVYRIRMQQNGGFSVTMAGSIFDLAASIMRNSQIRERYKTNISNILPDTDKALFMNEMDDLFDIYGRNDRNLSVIGKDNTVYLRCTRFGYDSYNRNYRPLFSQILIACDYIKRLKSFTEKINELNTELTRLTGGHTNVDRLVCVSAEEIRRQLSDF